MWRTTARPGCRTSADQIVNRSIAPEHVRDVTRRAVPRLRVVDVGSAGAARHARPARGEVPVFRPQARPSKERVAAREKAHANGGERRRDHQRQEAERRQREARAEKKNPRHSPGEKPEGRKNNEPG